MQHQVSDSGLKRTWNNVKYAGGLLVAGIMSAAGCDCAGRPAMHIQRPDVGVPEMADASPSRLDAESTKQDAGVPVPLPVFLIGDFIDRLPGNRDIQYTFSDYYPFSTPETDSDANPFSNGLEGAMEGALHADLSVTRLYRIDGSQFEPLSIFVTSAKDGTEYVGRQDIWLTGDVRYLETYADVVADVRGLYYTLKFSGASNEFGIPVSAGDVRIQFLGEEWSVTAMTPPAKSVGEEGAVTAGGSITLRNEKTGQVMELANGQAMPGNDEYRVVLGWKNGSYLRSIIVYTDDLRSLLNVPLSAGDTVPVVQNPANWSVVYNGLDITDEERDALRFQLERHNNRNLEVHNAKGKMIRCTVFAPYVRITSGTLGAFRLEAEGGKGTGSQAYVTTNGAECDDGSLEENSILIPSGTSATKKDVWLARNYEGPIHVAYELAGEGIVSWADGGVITIASASDMNPVMLEGIDFDGSRMADVRTFFIITEHAGAGAINRMAFGLRHAMPDGAWTFNFNGVISGTPYLQRDRVRSYLAGPVAGSAYTANEGLISERGSVFASITDSEVEFLIAKTFAQAVLSVEK